MRMCVCVCVRVRVQEKERQEYFEKLSQAKDTLFLCLISWQK
jgi:hypothetical protein